MQQDINIYYYAYTYISYQDLSRLRSIIYTKYKNTLSSQIITKI